MDAYVIAMVVIAAMILINAGLMVAVVLRRRARRLSPQQKAKIRDKWDRIIVQNNERAVLEADKLADYVMGCQGMRGTMGEKLKRIHKGYSGLDDIWWAHKLRNRIAHEMDVRIRPEEVRRALEHFERFLKWLGAM